MVNTYNKMRAILCVILVAAAVLAEKKSNRPKPFVADAVGNTLPPPSNLPATVGSPVNLLTPDRYEFYTFDESGELVKRLMTLEEIQAIVAAGEDSDGLVTFANDNQPTIAFNFSQPPFTKVHSVVTNVQNVLKAQMEAHRNKPLVQPTLDTPDVSDSWSLILPSIFGNAGVDIVPDKTTNSFTPETDTLENNFNIDDEDNSLSKEGGSDIPSTTIAGKEELNEVTKTLSSTTTTEKPTTTTSMPTTTTVKTTVTTTRITRKPTTFRPRTTTTTTTTTRKPITTRGTTTTTKPSTTTKATTTTTKPTTTTTTKLTTTSTKPTTTHSTTTKTITTTPTPTVSTTTRPTTTKLIIRITPKTTTKPPPTTTKLVPTTVELSTTEKLTPEFEKLSTFIPLSTIKYVTEKTTYKPVTTKSPVVYVTTTKQPSTTTLKSIPPISTTVQPVISSTRSTSAKPNTEEFTPTIKDSEDNINSTTVTTQSVSPSTTVSSTEFIASENGHQNFAMNGMKDSDPVIPLFDVAQSISQIASDLGNSYQPIPTSSTLLDTTKINSMDMESKEILDMDIPSANEEQQNATQENNDNFIKISTIDPHPQEEKIHEDKVKVQSEDVKITTEGTTTENIDLSSITFNSEATTIDPILSESMGDLLSQVVNQVPQNVVHSHEASKESNEIPTAENIFETTTEFYETTSESLAMSTKSEISSTTFKLEAQEKTTEKPKIDEKISHETVKKDDIPVQSSLDSDSKLNITEDNKEYVQISVSNTNDVSKIEPSTKNVTVKENLSIEDRINIPTETNDLQNKDENEKQEPLKVQTTTSTPKVDITTKLTMLANEKISQSNVNKINTLDKNINKKDKLPEHLPKFDEFKKKIQKVDDEELNRERNNSWKLIPTVTPPKVNDIQKDKIENTNNSENKNVILEYSTENQGLEVTTKDLGEDIAQFTELCNELAFRYWNVLVESIDKRRSFVLSPYSITSMLAMMFMGARGATSGEMNDILKLDDMVTFNPHFTLKNISDSIETTPETGIIVSAFIRELYSDRNKGKILTFYKERAQHFYNGHVEEINFKLISDIIRRRTNLLVKRYTWGKISEFMKSNSIGMKPPLAAFSTNIFETDCTGSSVEGRDGEMYFVVSPNIRQRRLVPVPAVVYKSGFLAGYDPVLDATAAALGNTNSIVSTIFLMPGQQGNIVHSDDLEKLEQRLLEANPTKPVWSRVLRTLLPRVGLELQIPRFSHKSVFNVSSTLKEMGLNDLFDANHADLGGLNGPSKDLYLSDMVQMTSFVTCGEGMIGDQHHVEEYPETTSLTRHRSARWINDWDEPRDYQRAFHDPHDVGEAMHLPLHLRPRQARLPTRSVQPARLKFDRPFLFFVRHNPSGMILYVGRYNPRLLP